MMENSTGRDGSELPGLSRSDLDDNPILQFANWLQEAQWFGVVEANAMTLATATPDGRPSQRMVLLKNFDDSGFVFYTNLESRKAREIAANPQVSLHFAWLPLYRQVIISGSVEKLPMAEAYRYFSTRPRDSQLAAWASQQSRPIASQAQLERQFQEMKRKFSDEEKIPLPSFWGGYRVRPDSVEFWQGRQHRLHDRFVYRREAEVSWTIERLSP
jgi:pyridoxamine 5'-phosphate oxidase